MKRENIAHKILRIGLGLVASLVVSASFTQGTWTWQQQCSSNEWRTICQGSICGYDQNGNPVYWYANNWGHMYCGYQPSLPGPGSIVLFPTGSGALLASNVDIFSVTIASGALLDWSWGTMTLRDPGGANPGSLSILSGGTLLWSEGSLDLRSDSSGNPGTLTNAGVLRWVGSYTRGLSGLLVNQSQLVHEAGITYFNGATVRNATGATAEVRFGNWYNNSGTNRVENSGTLRKTSPDPNNPTSFSTSVNTTNSGLISVESGTLTFNTLAQTNGETRIYRNATLSVNNPLAMQGGKLTGAGTLSGNLNNTAGAIAPGIDDPSLPDQNPLGILTLNGNLTMGADAVFEVELAGTDNSDPANPQYDRVVVSGSGRTVQLDGTLRVKGRGGYVPALGDTFDILVRTGSWWNFSGAFHTVEVDADTLPCVAFEVQYLSDRVRIVASAAGSPDINRDGCVDDADLLAVLFAFGQTGSALPEDTNCDGVVDDADLLEVLFAFGQGC